MSDDNREHDPEDPRLREAARWLVDLQDPNLSPEELLRWNKWRESEANRAAFDSLASLWRAIHSGAEGTLAVSEEAACWYFRCVHDPHPTPSDRRDFLAWLRSSPEHIAELFKLARFDRKLRHATRPLRE